MPLNLCTKLPHSREVVKERQERKNERRKRRELKRRCLLDPNEEAVCDERGRLIGYRRIAK